MAQYRPSEEQLNQMMTGAPAMTAGPDDVGQDPEQASVLAAAEEVDQEHERAMDMAAPQGAYSVESLNDLVDSLNKVLPMFNETQPYPSFSEGIDGELPTEFVSALMMVSQAATDAGLERLAPDLENMGDDAGLDRAARMMDTLAYNQTFKTFLKSTTPGTPQELTDAAPAEAAPVEPMPAGPQPEEMDQLLAARA